MDISVVIPVYGCKAALPELYKRLKKVLGNLVKEYEIIFINDACPEGSWEIIEDICESDSSVVGIELSRNFGQLKATMAGLDYSTGKWIIVMDCDLQDKPEEIVKLYNKAIQGYDVVFARRIQRKDTVIKKFFSKLFYKVYSFATDVPYDESLCNFSISSRNVIDNYCKMREHHRGYVTYIRWMGFKETSIEVEHQNRYSGKSGYDFKKKIDMALELLTSQSDKILRMTVKCGFAITLLAFFSIIITLIRYFTMNIQVGWTSLFLALFFMSGLIIFSIGIVGIYIGNIFMEVKHRPLYIIRQVVNGKRTR